MASATCKTCEWEKANGILIDESKSNAGWARQIGIDESSIRRHKAHSSIFDQSRSFVSDGSDTLLAELDIPEEIVTSRGMSLRDPVTNSWQKVTWQPNKKAVLDSLKYDDLKDALDGFVAWPQWGKSGLSSFRSSVFAMSDLQIGKASQRLGGTPETIARVHNSINLFVNELQSTPPASLPESIVIWDGGDSVENHWNTPEQIATNDLALPEQIRVARRLFLEAIKAIAPYAPKIYFVSVPSNHGQSRVGYKAAGGTVDADFGLEISYQLEDAVRENPSLNHVEFIRPEPLMETAELDVSGTKLAFNHGHRSSSQKTHSDWWAKQSHGRMPGWDADILLTAHYHNLGVTQSGNGRWIVQTSSSDAGSDWYTYKSGETAIQGVTAFDVSDGMWSNLRIL